MRKVRCIICFGRYPKNQTVQSICKCVYICKKHCVNIIELNTSFSDRYYYEKHHESHSLICSRTCIYYRWGDNFIRSIEYYINKNTVPHPQSANGIIYKHQQKKIKRFEYLKYIRCLNKYFINDLTNIIIEYLIE